MNEHVQPLASDDLPALCVEEQIIAKSKTTYGRLPMMEELFEQFQATLILALNDYMSTKTNVTLKSFEYVSFGGALEAFSYPSLFGITKADPWGGTVTVVAEPELIFPVIQTMLGGRPSSSSIKTRNFTSLEKRIAAKFYDVVMRELARKLSEVTPVTFLVDTLKEDPEEMDFVPFDGACAKVVMEITLEEQSGLITFIIPYIAFETVSAAFSQPFRGGDIGGKDIWRKAMSNTLQSTDVLLTAVLKEIAVPLHEVLSWRQDQVLDIGVDTEQEVLVTCNQQQMFHAAMGCRKNGSVALKISKTLTEMDG